MLHSLSKVNFFQNVDFCWVCEERTGLAWHWRGLIPTVASKKYPFIAVMSMSTPERPVRRLIIRLPAEYDTDFETESEMDFSESEDADAEAESEAESEESEEESEETDASGPSVSSESGAASPCEFSDSDSDVWYSE